MEGVGPGRGRSRGETYNMANLRGRRERTGNRAKQITKQARAAKLQPPNISMRSHLLTVHGPAISLFPACTVSNVETYMRTMLLPLLFSSVPEEVRRVIRVWVAVHNLLV